MSSSRANIVWRLRVALARAQQAVGWPGMLGVALLIVGGGVAVTSGWTQHQFERVHRGKSVVLGGALPAPEATARETKLGVSTALAVPQLPSASDVPALLKTIEQAATANDLDWRAAEYRLVAATSTQPAGLVVRCTLKGPYPKLRSMLVELMSAVPAFTIREFSASRASTLTADIETKLELAVLLQDGVVSTDMQEAP